MFYPAPGQPAGYSSQPYVRFDAIAEAWSLFSAQMGNWILMILILAAVIVGLYFVCTIFLGAALLAVISLRPGQGLAVAVLLPILGVGFLYVLAMAFLTSGLWKAALKTVRHLPMSVGDLFSGGSVFGFVVLYELMIVGAVVAALFIPFVGLVALPALVLVSPLLMFSVPLIIDQRLNPIAALALSWRSLLPQYGPALGYFLLTNLIAMAGSLCAIGALFAVPTALLSHAILYRDFFPQAGPVPGSTPYLTPTITSAAPEFPAIPTPLPPAAAPLVPGPRLVGTAGAYVGQVFLLRGDTVIGRDPSSPLPLDRDATVSRRHARIFFEGGRYRIVDEGSSNGTHVNGERVTDAELHSGDEVIIGGTRFRFEA